MAVSPLLKKVETAFGLPFDAVIKEYHAKTGISILAIANRAGVSRDFIYRECKKRGLNTNSAIQAALFKYKHHKHWALGKTKENSDWARKSSDRMKKNNPIRNVEAAKKRARTVVETFKSKNLPQEVEFKNLLKKYNVNFIEQYPIGSYNIDFFIKEHSLCIEIDSTEKWGYERRKHAGTKDGYLKRNGYEVFRLDKRKIKTFEKLLQIFNANNIIRKS